MVELGRFFEHAMRATFRDLALHDETASAYLADLLARFARTAELYRPGTTIPRLETVVDMLLDVQAAWLEDAPRFNPEHEVQVRRHIGDYTLFMTGIFPERVDRVASRGYYISQGKRAYRFVWEHDRAAGCPTGPMYRALAERFEYFVGALDYARRVHFPDPERLPFLRLGLS